MKRITCRIELPANMKSWKTYTLSLLSQLPQTTAKAYREKFRKSIIFWRKKGGTLDDQIIVQLEELGIKINVKGVSKKTNKKIITLSQSTPDDTLPGILAKTPSWKRMCLCILKNDTKCEYMGF